MKAVPAWAYFFFGTTFDLDFSQTPGSKVKFGVCRRLSTNFDLDYEEDTEWIHAAFPRYTERS